ncbi:MAG: YiiD C-terminal domain-containing protein [Candidatus Rokubacteria bacterium]|nr:YiiD C-terminal domain-containing protein [Candidatus Rokubacteria bacterium]
MSEHVRALRAKLRTEMPVTQRLGIRVVGRRDGQVVLSAPLAANTNHEGTAFAGSLNAVATLAGWATVWLLLRDHGLQAHAVIQDSTVRYLRPVTGDFEALARPLDAAAVARLLEAIRRRGRGRIEIEVVVSDARGAAVAFQGRYVALADGARVASRRALPSIRVRHPLGRA